MLLTIDVGNSRIKVAVFEHNKQLDFYVFETEYALKKFKNIIDSKESKYLISLIE
jgi:type III pantothenate kinase